MPSQPEDLTGHFMAGVPLAMADVDDILRNIPTWTCHARECGRPLGEYQILFARILNELKRRMEAEHAGL